MGAGLAKEFASQFPKLAESHADLCRNGSLDVGQPRMVTCSSPYLLFGVRQVILFPTKLYWRNDSRYDWIFMGLGALYKILGRHMEGADEIQLAMPALGCGLGHMNWPVVANMIRCWSAGLPERYSVTLYAPKEG